MDVSGVSSQMDGTAALMAQAGNSASQSGSAPVQNQQDVGTQIETAVMKMVMDEQKMLGKGVLDLLA